MNTSIVIPTYNERENIVALVGAIRMMGRGIAIIIVDDNSPDGTGAVADELARQYPEVSVIHRAQKSGLGTAYIAGFKQALAQGADCVFEMDADLQHPPRFIPAFLEAINTYDVVLGSRYCQGGGVETWHWSRLLLSKMGTLYARLITGLPVTDATGGFKCFRREVLERIDLDTIRSNGYSFQIEMNYRVWHAGFSIGEVPIMFEPRQRGASKLNKHDIAEALRVVWRLRFLK